MIKIKFYHANLENISRLTKINITEIYIFRRLAFVFLIIRGPTCPPITTDGTTKISALISTVLFSKSLFTKSEFIRVMAATKSTINRITIVEPMTCDGLFILN